MSAQKRIAMLGASLLSLGGYDALAYMPKQNRGRSHKDYKDKNRNVEYYTDEKGNIRRRKKKC